MCKFRLPCGHACVKNCHFDNSEHKTVKCMKRCKRIRDEKECPFKHPCTKLCSTACGRCEVLVDYYLPCGHTCTIKCYQTLEPRQVPCSAKVQVRIVGCDHINEIPCSERKKKHQCNHPCKKVVKTCGHPCSGICGDCRINGHQCKNACGRHLLCGHYCNLPCHPQDAACACTESCSVECSHSRYQKQCKLPCDPCAEKCEWRCEHQKCTLLCGSPCLRLPCDKICRKKLNCGHNCPSLCGEKCPTVEFCPTCAPPKRKEQVVDMLEFKTLEENFAEGGEPIIVLPCEHAYTISTLDGIMEMDKFYSKNKNDKWVEAKPLEQEMVGIANCPECRKPVVNVFRYSRRTNQAILGVCQLKHRQYIKSRLSELAIETKKIIETEPKNIKTFSRVKRQYINLMKGPSPVQKVYEGTVAALMEYYGTAQMVAKNNIKPDTTVLIKIRIDFIKLVNEILRVGLKSDDKLLNILIKDFQSAQQEFKSGVSLCKESKALGSHAQILVEFIKLLFTWLDVVFLVPEENRQKLEASSQDAIFSTIEKYIKQLLAFPDPIIESQQITKQTKIFMEELDHNKNGRVRYQKLTLQEKLDIAKAMKQDGVTTAAGSFGGHWYKCPNGHIFTIGECGGAMEVSTCNECGERIGGERHNLLSTNVVATDFLRSIS